jgi:hypothetical protein
MVLILEKTIVEGLFRPLVDGFFLKDFIANVKGIDLLKLRGGWGRLGNQNVPLNNQAYSSGLSSYLGGSTLYEGTTINSQVDPSLSWEITEEASAGLDFELLDRRLKGSFDVYDKTVISNYEALCNIWY